jgi:hypothetical protein
MSGSVYISIKGYVCSRGMEIEGEGGMEVPTASISGSITY